MLVDRRVTRCYVTVADYSFYEIQQPVHQDVRVWRASPAIILSTVILSMFAAYVPGFAPYYYTLISHWKCLRRNENFIWLKENVFTTKQT